MFKKITSSLKMANS